MLKKRKEGERKEEREGGRKKKGEKERRKEYRYEISIAVGLDKNVSSFVRTTIVFTHAILQWFFSRTFTFCTNIWPDLPFTVSDASSQPHTQHTQH